MRVHAGRALAAAVMAAGIAAGADGQGEGEASGATKVVFVTAEQFPGDLGGVAGADRKCHRAALRNGLGGTFMAWLASGADNAPAERFARAQVPYVRTDGVRVADDWADLTDGSLAAPIDHTAAGALATDGYSTWTNVTTSGGLNTGAHCEHWTAAESKDVGDYQGWDTEGAMGDFTSTEGDWTQFSSAACGRQKRLYCFQQ